MIGFRSLGRTHFTCHLTLPSSQPQRGYCLARHFCSCSQVRVIEPEPLKGLCEMAVVDLFNFSLSAELPLSRAFPCILLK